MLRGIYQGAAVASIAVIVAGCSLNWSATPNPNPKAKYTNPPPTPTLSAIATVAPSGPRRPYTPEQITALLEDYVATHPVAIASTLRQPAVIKAIASVLADDIYSYDGQPYVEVYLGGRCGEPPDLCTLQLVGVPPFAADRDASDSYHWEVKPQIPLVTLTGVGLGGYPRDLADSLDTLARSLDTEGRIGDRTLQSTQWSIPPPDGAFVLCYNHNLDVENPSLEDPSVCVRFDRTERRVLSIGPYP